MRESARAALFFVFVVIALFAPLAGCPHYRDFGPVLPR